MSGTNVFKGHTAYSTKAILLPATLNCLLSVSCVVMSFSACVCSTLGRPQSCNSCFCSFLSFILPPAAKIARLAFFFHLNFAPDTASAASLTSAAQLAWLSQQRGYACSGECILRHCKPLCVELAHWDCHPCKLFAESNSKPAAAAHTLGDAIAPLSLH